MRVTGFRSFGRARAALLLAATARRAGGSGQAQTAAPAAATAPHAELGTWGVDLARRDLYGQARRGLPEICVRNLARRNPDRGRQARGRLVLRAVRPQPGPAEGAGHQRARGQQIWRAVPEHDGRGGASRRAASTPLKADLAKVAAIKTKAEMARHMGATDRHFRKLVVRLPPRARHGRRVDERAQPLQSGLGLPNRDYYLKPEFKPQRDAYRAYIERTFKAIGNANPAAAADRRDGVRNGDRAR